MHKSALLKYFTTRDEIYLRLAETLWEEWTSVVRSSLAGASSIQDVARAMTSPLAERPLFCDLIAHAALNLERNVPIGSARAYNRVVLPAIERMLQDIREVLPYLDETDLFDLVAMVTGVAAGLYQIANPPPPLAALYRTDPELGHATLDFRETLQRIAETFLAGLASRKG
jgi:AcrR family transcriptional regulator